MSKRIEFELTDNDLTLLKKASKPTPVMYLSGGQSMFASPQENANQAWAKLGRRMGFDPMSVRPVQGKDQKFFTAEPTVSREEE